VVVAAARLAVVWEEWAEEVED
jgi:hypothetical protein